jgi:purine-binding chemotaxis protein CheW
MHETNKIETDAPNGPTVPSSSAAHPNSSSETDAQSSDEAAVQPPAELLPDQPFLIFSERGMRYALPAGTIREALRLPRLTALEETAPWVLGAFELRGELVPLLSPALCLRHPPPPSAQLSDLAVVADCAGHPMAFHADQITSLARPRRVLPIPTDAAGNGNGTVIAYEIALDDGIARVLDPRRVRLHAVDAAEVSDLPDDRLNSFEQALDAAALQELSARAALYSLVPGTSAERSDASFVLLGIGGETLATPAADCMELVRIGALVPVPGTPAHILGFGALRGEVITVVDVRSALGFATAGLWEPPLMVVIRFGGQRTGIAVDAAFAIHRTRLGPCEELPLALRTMGEHWLRGAIHVDADNIQSEALSDGGSGAGQDHQHPLPVVDLAALLEWGRLIVDGPA